MEVTYWSIHFGHTPVSPVVYYETKPELKPIAPKESLVLLNMLVTAYFPFIVFWCPAVQFVPSHSHKDRVKEYLMHSEEETT
jgi:hypothetical protein